jgi:hypothetical protein
MLVFSLLLLLSLSRASGTVELLPLSGTWLDVAYDGRLKYANSAALAFSCSDWGLKVGEMYALGIRLIIFQAVHDSRFGAYYASSLPFMAPWPGLCPDVVEAVLAAADALPGMQVLLSAEYYGTEADPVANATVMEGRLAIMQELAATKVPQHRPSFWGWYFSAEGYLSSSASPYFVPQFFDYIGALSAAARRLTPGALVFISPYGTRYAVADATYVAQLQQLGQLVDVIAYQDEVGCVRAELPLATVCDKWRTLRAAHTLAGPGAPALWANVESFTWEGPPNNVSSALIPAPLPRLLAQLRCAAAAPVDRVVTFTVEAMYQSPSSPAPWGPPSGDAQRLHTEYSQAVFEPTPYAALRAACIVQGRVAHAGLGAAVAALAPPPLPPGQPSALTDGLTGAEDPYAPAWLGFPLQDAAGGCSRPVEVVLDLAEQRCFGALGLHALQVPAAWYVDGGAGAAVQRNVSAALPAEARFWVANASATGPWSQAGLALRPQPWAQELYDLRSDVLAAGLEGGGEVCARFVKAVVTPGAPPQGAPPPPACPLILISELMVLEGSL